MALEHGLRNLDELAPAVLGALAEHHERPLGVDRVALHENPLRLLDDRAAAERLLETVVLGEGLQGGVDGALELGRVVMDDAREHPAAGGLANEPGVVVGQQGDDGARDLADGRGDELERPLRARAEADENYVWALPRDRAGDVAGRQRAHDGVVSQPRHDFREKIEAGV